MALTDKDILITPNDGSSTADPKTEFTGANSSASDTITLETQFDGSITTLSYEGSAGQLFSISNDLSGTIFAVNDSSGIPSLEINNNGEIRLSEFDGNVIVGNTNSTPLSSLFEGRLIVKGSGNQDPIMSVTDSTSTGSAAGVFHQSSTSPSFPAFVVNSAANSSSTSLISAYTNVNNTTGVSGTEVFKVTGQGNLTITGTLNSSTVNTGQGSTEVHLMNQNIRTTDSPTFDELTVTDFVKASGNNIKFSAGGTHVLNIDLNRKIYPQTDNSTDIGFSSSASRFRDAYFTGTGNFGTINTGQGATEVHLMNQNLRTTDSPTFATLNVTGDLNITGDLNTVSATDLDILDKTITLGKGGTASANDGAGIIVEAAGASLKWDNSDAKWAMNRSLQFDDTPTTTNQNLGVFWTAFDKEGTTDFSDAAYIRHTTNIQGLAGSVLEIKSNNDANDGIAFTTNGSSQLKHNSNTIWTAGNDGSGSGLDADTVDSLHASQFLRSDAADTATGQITFSNTPILAGTTSNEGGEINFGAPTGGVHSAFALDNYQGHFRVHTLASGKEFRIHSASSGLTTIGSNIGTVWGSGNDGAGSGLDADTVDGIQGGNFLRTDTNDSLFSGNATLQFENQSSFARIAFYKLSLWEWNVGEQLVIDNGNFNVTSSTFTKSGSTVWHAGNDGSGSGLDADTVDGIQGASLLRSDAEDLYSPTRLDFGSSGGWDAVGFSNLTNLHMRDHNQFWIGAGNGTWFTGTANSKSSTSGLAADATKAHDLLITTMQGTSTYDRGITFAVDSGGAGNSGYRLGKWHSSNEQHSSKLTIDGGLHVRGGDMANYDYYADDYSTYWDDNSGGAYWPGDTGWIDPSITAGNALQIQAGNATTNSNNPALQFHQYGYGGVQLRYDGPNDVMHLESTGSDRFDYFQIQTDHGNLQIGPMNTSYAHIYTNISGGFYFNRTGLYANGNTMWHAGNDGSGSGLDSDLLDGQHGSYYAAASSLSSYLPLAGGTMSGDISMSGNDMLGASTITLNANPIGTTYGNTVSSTPANMISQVVGGNDGWRLYGEGASNDVQMIFEIIDDLEAGDTWIFRNKKTYGNYDARNEFIITGEGTFKSRGNGYVNTNQRVFADDYHPNADKWTTARTLTLTGDATGSGSWDGSGNLTITTVVGDDSHFHHRLDSTDDRDVKPSDTGIVTSVQAIKPFFTSFGGMTGSGNSTYLDMLAFDTYSDSSGGGPSAITFHKGASAGDPKMYIWKAGWNATTWSTGQRVFADNYHPNADTWTTARTITLGGDLSGSVSINGSANVTLTATVTDDSHNHNHSDGDFTVNGHLYGRSVNNAYSNVYRMGGYYFTWDSDSYGTNTHHSIRSTYGDSYGDDITLNSYHRIRMNLDSNNNNGLTTEAFEIGHNTTGTGNRLFQINGNAHMTLGYDGQAPNFKMVYDDNHGSGDNWDTVIQLGRIQDKHNGSGNYPTYQNQNGYGLYMQSNSDGCFWGMEEYTSGNYRPVMAWGDDTSDSPAVFRYNNGTKFGFTYDGTFHADGNIVAYSTTVSDIKHKENITTIENAIDKVKELRGVEFDWKATGKKGEHDIGFIAQEVEKVLPELVSETEMITGEFEDTNEKSKSVAYGNVTALLVEAVKEQQQTIEQQKNLINRLEERLNNLEKNK